MDRISRVAKGVKLLAHAFLWISLIAAAISAWLVVTRGEELSTPVLVTFAYDIALGVLLAVMFRHVARLATRFEAGELFSTATVAHLRAIGWLALLTTASPGLAPSSSALQLELVITPSAALVGLLLVFLSWVLDEARALKLDNDLVI